MSVDIENTDVLHIHWKWAKISHGLNYLILTLFARVETNYKRGSKKYISIFLTIKIWWFETQSGIKETEPIRKVVIELGHAFGCIVLRTG